MTLTDNGNGTATLAGTSSVAAGVYTFSIQAANGVSPNATQAFTLTVTSAPAFTSGGQRHRSLGSSFTYSVTTTGTPTPAITLASGSTLPSGVTLTDNGNGTATLAGTRGGCRASIRSSSRRPTGSPPTPPSPSR